MPTRSFAACLAGIVLIGPLAVHLFLPAIPAVKAEFALSDAMAQLTFSIGILALALSTLVYGTLSDRYGRRPVLMGGLVLFLVGCAILATARSLPALLLGRVIQAAGAGCAMTLVRTIARDAYGQAHLAKAIAYLTMFYTLGPMVSPLVGGILIDAAGWRAAFVFALLLGSAVTAGAMVLMHETHTGTGGRLDPVAVLRSYVVPFHNPCFAALVLQTAFSTGVFFTCTGAFAIIMKEQLGRPATDYGIYFITFPLGFLIGNVIATRLVGRVAGETLVLAGSLMLMASVLVQGALLLSGQVTPLTLFGPGLFMTMAQGIALPSAQSGAIALMPHSVGTAAAIGVCVQNLAGAAVSQLYGLMAGRSLVPLVVVCMLSAGLTLLCGLVPYRQARRGTD